MFFVKKTGTRMRKNKSQTFPLNRVPSVFISTLKFKLKVFEVISTITRIPKKFTLNRIYKSRTILRKVSFLSSMIPFLIFIFLRTKFLKKI